MAEKIPYFLVDMLLDKKERTPNEIKDIIKRRELIGKYGNDAVRFFKDTPENLKYYIGRDNQELYISKCGKGEKRVEDFVMKQQKPCTDKEIKELIESYKIKDPSFGTKIEKLLSG